MHPNRAIKKNNSVQNENGKYLCNYFIVALISLDVGHISRIRLIPCHQAETKTASLPTHLICIFNAFATTKCYALALQIFSLLYLANCVHFLERQLAFLIIIHIEKLVPFSSPHVMFQYKYGKPGFFLVK